MVDPLRDLWRASVSGVLFPIHEYLKGHDSVSRRRALERSQWWSPQELADYRSRRLQAFLSRAGERVPYYRSLFHDLGILQSESVSGFDLLHRLPLLDKSGIRSNLDALRAEDARGLMPFNTGGSTGEPLTFFLSRERVSHDVAAKWRATRWWGVDIGDPEAVLWGSPIELGAQDRLKALRDRLLRTRLFPAFAMSEANMDRYLREIRRMRPRMLFGYPTALALLAERARKTVMAMYDLDIHVAFVTGERLYPEQRSMISEVFGCRVANGYGGRDAGFVAHECPEGGMHLSAEDIIVEVVDEQGNPVSGGEPGELVVTHLATADFPFIRYRTGDVGVLDDRPCPCGRGLPLLGEIHGRDTDFVVAADGTAMHGLALIYSVREQRGVQRFRIVQESLQRTRVEVVPDEQWSNAVATNIQEGFRRRLGEAVDIEVVRVDDIPPERSGKYRYVVSHVSPKAMG